MNGYTLEEVAEKNRMVHTAGTQPLEKRIEVAQRQDVSRRTTSRRLEHSGFERFEVILEAASVKQKK
jgi:hypothetical protein